MRNTAVLLVSAALALGLTAAPSSVQVDLRQMPLPAEQPELSRNLIECHLDSAEMCELMTEVLLSMPVAWQHAGYRVHVDEEADPDRNCGRWSRRSGREPDGCALKQEREIWLFPSWTGMVERRMRLGLDGPVRALTRTMAHELGHVMHQSCPYEALTLARYRHARSIGVLVPVRGHGTQGAPRFSSVAEDFAEMATVHLLPERQISSRSPLSDDVTPSQMDALAEEFFHICLDTPPNTTIEDEQFTPLTGADLYAKYVEPYRRKTTPEQRPTVCSSSVCYNPEGAGTDG